MSQKGKFQRNAATLFHAVFVVRRAILRRIRRPSRYFTLYFVVRHVNVRTTELRHH
jgi:hypothetical protein